MQQPAFDWSRDPDPDPAPVLFQPGSHTSFKAARHLARTGTRGVKIGRLLEAYRVAGAAGLNDSEMEARAQLLRSSICSLRKAVRECGLIEKCGERLGAYGLAQDVWRLTRAGKALLRTQAAGGETR